MQEFIGALDQGTTSTRFIVFDRSGQIVSSAQHEHQQIYPQPGWVEHDPDEIWLRTQQVTADAMQAKNLRASDLAAIGITNQRETTIAWDRRTGQPVHNAIVWQDTRVEGAVAEFSRDSDDGQDRFRRKTGLPLATYFSALKTSLDSKSRGRRTKKSRSGPAFVWHRGRISSLASRLAVPRAASTPPT